MWQVGDALLGDPPDEQQGWYGVYDADTSTLQLIREFARQLKTP
jgi:mannan endo-1,4-beta-mannosidase